MKQVFGPFLDGFANVGMELWEHLREKTFAALTAHEAAKRAMATPEDVQRRGAYVRETFLASIGGLPDMTASLNPRLCGRIERGAYTIEKVIFESLPNAYVTSLLYLPHTLDAPAPGILFLSGHHRDAKANPEYQRMCHDLALSGFVVLATDPPGQGERVTHLDPDTGHMIIEWGTTEHSYQGQQCVLTGTSIARYFLADALRGIDYLQSRPEVDPEQIGVTGNSGGGTQTSLVCMSGDARVKAAVPCTYVTSREHYFMTGQPQDCEQLQFGMTRNGINFDDFFIPFSPRPLLIGGVESDFFNPEGTDLTFERLRRIYAIFGMEKNVARVFAPGRHCYARELREAAVNWFRKYLLYQAPDFRTCADEAIETTPPEALWCTTKGHVLTDFPKHQTPYHLNLRMIPKRENPPSADSLRERVVSALGICERLQRRVGLYPRTVAEQSEDGVYADSILFRSEPGITVCGCLLRRENGRGSTVTLRLTRDGTCAIESEIERFSRAEGRGGDWFVFDVRGVGAAAPHPVNPYPNGFPMTFFNTEGWFAWSAYCLGESLFGMRVFDVLRACEYLHGAAGYARVRIETEGFGASLWGYLAAALDPRVCEARIGDLLESFDGIARTELYRTDFVPGMLIHGVLKEFDLPELRGLFMDRALDLSYANISLNK